MKALNYLLGMIFEDRLCEDLLAATGTGHADGLGSCFGLNDGL